MMTGRRQRILSLAGRLGGLLGVRIGAMVLMMVQTLLITRVFGAEAFGQLSFALSVGAISILLICFGLDQLLMRDLARIGAEGAAAQKDWRPKLVFVGRFVAVLQLLICGGGLLFVVLSGGLPEFRLSLIVVLFIIPLQVYRRFFEVLLQGAKMTTRSMIGSQIGYPAFMILGIGLALALGVTPSIESLLWIYGAAIVLSTMLAFALFRPLWGRIRPAEAPETAESAAANGPAMLRTGFNMALVALGFLVGQQIDGILIGLMRGPADVAEVKIALRVAELAGLLRTVAVIYYRPRVVEAHAKGPQERLGALAREQAVLFSATGLVIVIVVWLAAEQIMGIFGPEFVAAANVTRVYLLGVFITMLCGPSNMMLAYTGHERIASRILVGSLVVQVILDLILIPQYGSLGCAIANAVGLTIFALGTSIFAYRKTGVNPTISSVLRFGKGE